MSEFSPSTVSNTGACTMCISGYLYNAFKEYGHFKGDTKSYEYFHYLDNLVNLRDEILSPVSSASAKVWRLLCHEYLTIVLGEMLVVQTANLKDTSPESKNVSRRIKEIRGLYESLERNLNIPAYLDLIDKEGG